MARFTPAQQALLTPEVLLIAQQVDPNINFDGDDNGADLTAVIVTESAVFRQQITAANINAGAWATIISLLTTLSTSAGDTPNPVS